MACLFAIPNTLVSAQKNISRNNFIKMWPMRGDERGIQEFVRQAQMPNWEINPQVGGGNTSGYTNALTGRNTFLQPASELPGINENPARFAFGHAAQVKP